jgi:hypothetical protein
MESNYATGDRVEIYDIERGLAGDKGTVVDVIGQGERLRIQLDAGGEIEARPEQCRRIQPMATRRAA